MPLDGPLELHLLYLRELLQIYFLICFYTILGASISDVVSWFLCLYTVLSRQMIDGVRLSMTYSTWHGIAFTVNIPLAIHLYLTFTKYRLHTQLFKYPWGTRLSSQTFTNCVDTYSCSQRNLHWAIFFHCLVQTCLRFKNNEINPLTIT